MTLRLLLPQVVCCILSSETCYQFAEVQRMVDCCVIFVDDGFACLYLLEIILSDRSDKFQSSQLGRMGTVIDM